VLSALGSAEGRLELCRHDRAGAISKRRFSAVTRTVISPVAGFAEPREFAAEEPHAGRASAAAFAASPAADNLRKSRLDESGIFILDPLHSRSSAIRVSDLSNGVTDKNLMRVK